MERGAAVRATGATKLNEISSRSHAIFMLIVEKSTPVAAEGGAGGGHDFRREMAWTQSSPMALATMRRVRRVSLLGSSWAARSSRGLAAPGLKR